MLVRDICDVIKGGYLLIEDTEKNEISNGTIEDEEILDLEVESIEPYDDVFVKVVVYN